MQQDSALPMRRKCHVHAPHIRQELCAPRCAANAHRPDVHACQIRQEPSARPGVLQRRARPAVRPHRNSDAHACQIRQGSGIAPWCAAARRARPGARPPCVTRPCWSLSSTRPRSAGSPTSSGSAAPHPGPPRCRTCMGAAKNPCHTRSGQSDTTSRAFALPAP